MKSILLGALGAFLFISGIAHGAYMSSPNGLTVRITGHDINMLMFAALVLAVTAGAITLISDEMNLELQAQLEAWRLGKTAFSRARAESLTARKQGGRV